MPTCRVGAHTWPQPAIPQTSPHPPALVGQQNVCHTVALHRGELQQLGGLLELGQHALKGGAAKQAQPSIGGLDHRRDTWPLQGAGSGGPGTVSSVCFDCCAPVPVHTAVSPPLLLQCGCTYVAAGSCHPLLLCGPAPLHGVDKGGPLQDALHLARDTQHVLDGCRGWGSGGVAGAGFGGREWGGKTSQSPVRSSCLQLSQPPLQTLRRPYLFPPMPEY